MDAASRERYRRLEEADRQGDEFAELCLGLCTLLGIGREANEEDGVDTLYCLAEKCNEYAYDDMIVIEPRMLAVQLCIILEEILNTRIFPIRPYYLLAQGPDEEEYE